MGAGVFGRFRSHVFLAGAPGNWRGQLRRDCAGSPLGPVSGQASGAGRWGSITWRLPVGTALGFLLGGTIADALGWQAVFFVVGLPGLLAAVAGLVHERPGPRCLRGRCGQVKAVGTALAEYLDLLKTKTFLFNTAGMAAVTFATGAYAAWGSTFYQREFTT